MDCDKYKVKILHYINPHLIWVLCKKEDADVFFYEQIGIYGILPLDIEINYDGHVLTKSSEEWLPAVSLKMQNIISEAVNVWFSVNYLDRTTSIFDNNLHKYGDLYLEMKNGTTLSLREVLLDTGLVDENFNFHQHLKTKLDFVTTVNVINKIKQAIEYVNICKYLVEVLNNQTSVIRQIIELEGIATVSHPNRRLLLSNHVNDLNACKDIDEPSTGRANHLSKSMSNRFLKLASKSMSNRLFKSDNISVVDTPALTSEMRNEIQFNKDNESTEFKENSEKQWKPSKSNNINKTGKNSKAKSSEKAKKYMALGPPGLNPLEYYFKEVTKGRDIPPKIDKLKNVEESEIKDNSDDFDNLYSEVNARINNENLLQMKHSIVSIKNTNENISLDLKNDRNNSINDEKTNSFSDEKNKSFIDKKNNSFNDKIDVKKHVTSRKLKYLKEKTAKLSDSFSTVETDSAVKKGDDSDNESITSLVNKLDISNNSIKKDINIKPDVVVNITNNVNPFKNLDGSKSVFVDKLIRPTLIAHAKNGNCIQPVSNLRDIPFGTEIHVILQNMSIKKPMRLQTVSWPMILRGHSLFLVSPSESGKTMGYLPAVCRLVNDSRLSTEYFSITPLTCIIICATAKSVSHVEELSKMFLHNARIFACYTGMTDISITTALLNGCDILITTPILLVRLLRDNLGIDLRNLNTFVIDDCERIREVYQNELKFCLFKVKDMLKSRVNKEVKVQYVVTSRIWCDFMSSLAKKAPDSIVCIAAFQECVLYSKVDTSVEFLKKENKMDALVKFLQEIDNSRKTVVVCRSDDEVRIIEKKLTNLKYIVFACDSNMTIHDLYSLDLALSEYQEPVLGPVLVCCDSNLAHLNVTDAHYLIHFSLPLLFSLFCKRFALLADNYQSIFNKKDFDVKIKIFLEDANVEELPKILNFIKRCSDNIPTSLDHVSNLVMVEKDMKKAESFVPLCNAFLTLGKCSDIWNCKQRHTLFQSFDEPKAWIPKEGVIHFKILHYHSAVHYSARMISCVTSNGIEKYKQTYSVITIKLGMYFSKESNRKLHGRANPGDICAVSLKLNLFARCQVIKVLKYTQSNLPSVLLINLIDEEKYEVARDTCLYYLPDELKKIDSHAVQVILSNLAPEDRDITYSKIAENQLKKITDTNEDLYMRANVSLVIGNCIFVETLEACQDLSSLNETVVKSNFRKELLEGHAINNPYHIKALKKQVENLEFMGKKEVHVQNIQVPKHIKILPEARWAHLESDKHAPVYYLYAKNPGLFFVQHVKFQDTLNILIKDIQKYVAENPESITDINVNDIVLAEFPDDKCYERARIDTIINDDQVKCFFVDLGDWAIVTVDKILSISEKIITQLPFQAIECRLVGVEPVGENWSEFATNWLVDQFYDTSSNLKYLFAKRFTKEQAEFTKGNKYGIALIDTYGEDVYINKLMIDANLAKANKEIEYFCTISIEVDNKVRSDDSDLNDNTSLTTDSDESNEANTNFGKWQSKCKINTSSQYLTKNTTTSINENSISRMKDIESDTANIEMHESNQYDKNLTDCASRPDRVKLEQNKDNELNSANLIQPIDNQDSIIESMKISKDQQNIMDLFRRKPIRSVPLVEDDDIDDDKWDSLNPLSMLTNPHQESNLSPTLEDMDNNETKIPAICYTKLDKPLEKEDAASDLGSEIIQYKNEQDENTATPTSISKNKSIVTCTGNETTYDNSQDTTISFLESMKENNLYYTILKNNKNTLILRDEISPNMFKELKLTWSQDPITVNLKIHVSVERYELNIKDKIVTFFAKTEFTDYGFQLELFSAVDAEKVIHSNKDTYIEITFIKITSNNWLSLNIERVKKVTTNDIVTADVNKTLKENATPLKSIFIDAKKPEDKLRKPKLLWCQNRYRITIKILLITDKYDLNIKDKYLNFYACANDEEYGFGINLHGVVDVKKSYHSNKGQYILVNLCKVMPKNWFTLNEGHVSKWIVYDVDGIDVSSDEETDAVDDNLRKNLNVHIETDTEDDFDDDIKFAYKKNY